MKYIITKFTLQNGLRYFKAACLLTLLGTNAFAQSASMNGPAIGQVAGTYILAGGNHQITVKADYTEQSYRNVSGNVTATGLQFGATQNTDAPVPVSQSAWTGMSTVSDPTAALFTGNADNTEAFNLKSGNAISMFSATRPLAEARLATHGRYLMGQVKLTFSEAVDNPILQIVGLGGSVTNGTTLGFTTELDMVSTGVALSKLSGNENLKVTGSSIQNSAAYPNARSNSGAASGSVLVGGSHIESLIFNVYMRGDGSGFTWENAGTYVGDRWLIGFSFNEVVPGKPAETAAKGSTPVALPIYVTNFSISQQEECGVAVRWNTSTELGINGFGVEHSVDGIDFRQIAYLKSSGNAAGTHYSYFFPNANNGANFFRIHIDNSTSQNGYTATVPLRVKCSSGNIQVQPNPTRGYLRVQGFTTGNTLSLFNMTGRQVQAQTMNGTETSIDLSELKEGLYMLIIKNEKGEELEKVRVQKI